MEGFPSFNILIDNYFHGAWYEEGCEYEAKYMHVWEIVWPQDLFSQEWNILLWSSEIDEGEI
jgi:hypothetical protein